MFLTALYCGLDMLRVTFICFVCSIVDANLYKNNLTDFSKCKVHYSRSGSVYKDFYSIPDSPESDHTLQLDFHFSVLAPSDAHILLAPSEHVEKNDPVYEIVIGAGGNTFCDIRRKQKSDVKASERVKGLLSALDPASFWLHITKDGSIELGREGEELPFISWIDPDPLPLKVISFSTWSGIEAKWYFACGRQSETHEIPKVLTQHERLRKDILYHYDPYVRPVYNITTVTVVEMALQITHLTLAWHDEKLKWTPASYGELETLHIFGREIWQPDLVLYNAVGDGRDITQESLMVAHYSGLVEWNPAIQLKAWCDAEDLKRWPKDKHRCNLAIGFATDFNNMQLNLRNNDTSLIYHDSSTSEWSILEVDVFNMDISENENAGPKILEMVFTIQRASNFYNTIYFTPFLVIAASVLMTFWMDPNETIKISLSCSQLILTTIMLLLLSNLIPSHSRYTPYLVMLYSFTLVAILTAIALAVIVINVSRNKQKTALPHFLCNILTAKVTEIMFLLPTTTKSEEYGKLNEASANKSPQRQQMMWILFGIFIDRISFLFYLALVIYAICDYY